MSVDDFLQMGSHVDFIFREKGNSVDIDAYFEKVYDLAVLLRRDTCPLRLLHQLWNLNGII
jgi:hypothetical protein